MQHIVWTEDSGGAQEFLGPFSALEDAREFAEENEGTVIPLQELSNAEQKVLDSKEFFNAAAGRHIIDVADDLTVVQMGDAVGIVRPDALKTLDTATGLYDGEEGLELDEWREDNIEEWGKYFDSVLTHYPHCGLGALSSTEGEEEEEGDEE